MLVAGAVKSLIRLTPTGWPFSLIRIVLFSIVVFL
jgi:hypothetical protein